MENNITKLQWDILDIIQFNECFSSIFPELYGLIIINNGSEKKIVFNFNELLSEPLDYWSTKYWFE